MSNPNLPLYLRPVHELLVQLEREEITNLELVESFLSQIEKHDSELGAFIVVYSEEARKLARAADKAKANGHAVGPFHGFPVAVKDIIDIEGKITTGGSKVWEQRRSPLTATVVRRMFDAGMIVLGKTHTVEFAMGTFGTNRHMGSPKNPWDLKSHRVPGGSSAGTGVSVAAGMAPWGIGTDTGGSVRIPSAWCGLAGLKTTIGRVSVHGILPLSHTLDTPGPMCRCVEDTALLYRLMAGPDPQDTRTLIKSVEDPIPGLHNGVSGLKLARLPDSELESVHKDVADAYEESLQILEGLGAQLCEVTLPRSFAEMGVLVGRIIGAEGYSYVGELIDDDTLPVDDDVRPRIAIGRDMSARDYLLTLREQQQIKAEFDSALIGIDALLTPTTAEPAPRIEDIDQSGTAAGFTRPVNLVERCAVVLPNGFTAQGLPTSLQIVCAPYQEALALRVGWAYEQATEWHQRFPSGLD
ncbi:MAG: amidase [Arenicellales bacterium]|nr:amidase [Arenicellales bacterium]